MQEINYIGLRDLVEKKSKEINFAAEILPLIPEYLVENLRAKLDIPPEYCYYGTMLPSGMHNKTVIPKLGVLNFSIWFHFHVPLGNSFNFSIPFRAKFLDRIVYVSGDGIPDLQIKVISNAIGPDIWSGATLELARETILAVHKKVQDYVEI